MYSIISLSRVFVYVISILLFIISIKNKNKVASKINIGVGIFFIVYLVFSITILTELLGIETGWEVLFNFFVVAIDIVVLITGIIINSMKLKRKELEEKDNKASKIFATISVSVPLVMVITSFIYELSFLNKCDLVLEFNYQNGIVISETTRVTVGKKFCKEISISEEFKNKEAKYLESYTYDIEENKDGEIIITSDYDDPELLEIDIETVKKIYKDENYTKKESALRLYEDESNVVYKGIITKIKGTDYYIVEHLISTEDRGGGTGLGSAVYYKTNFVNDIDVAGSIDVIYSYL